MKQRKEKEKSFLINIFKNLFIQISSKFKRKNLLDESIGKSFLTLFWQGSLGNITPKVQPTDVKIDKCNYFRKLKSVCTAKETINKANRQYRMTENICTVYI
jgi:hypothetical protein